MELGIGKILRAIWRAPIDCILISWINLVARIRTLTRPKLTYKDLGKDELRVLALLPALTNLRSEPVRCLFHHVSLDHTLEYKAWEENADPTLRLFRKSRAWLAHAKEKYGAAADYFQKASRYLWGDYIALSYSWGSNAANHHIIVDGQFVAVTESVESALRSARNALAFEKSTIRFWVDALCINQENIAERGGEVRRMKKIYGESMDILIHLGVESEDSDMAVEAIGKLAQGMRDGFDYPPWLRTLCSNVAEGKPAPEQAAFAAIFKFLCRPYWSRMWIIQEMAMGQDQLVCCGNRSVPLHDVRQVLKLFVLNAETALGVVGEDVYSSRVETFQATIGLLWWIGRVRELLLLPEDRGAFSYSELRSPILSLSQYSTATDARDKVYGMMGLLPSALASKIDRDDKNYEISTQEVYLNFSKAIIEVTGELDVIFASSLQQSSISKLGLPTWVTDWTLRQERTSGIDNSMEWYFGCEEGYAAADLPQPLVRQSKGEVQRSRADGGRKGRVEFSSDNKLLFCEGFCIGNIDGMAPEAVGSTAMSTRPDDIVQPQTELDPYGGVLEASQALFRTLLLEPSDDPNSILFQFPWFGSEADSDAEAGTFNFGDPSLEICDQLRAKSWDPSQFGGSFFSFEAFRRRNGMFRIGQRPFKDYFPQEVPDCPAELDFTVFATIVANSSGRRLVITKSGHIGLAPANVEPGDAIYILKGSSMPVILRPHAESRHFAVVGECFVDGFMKGEAMVALDNSVYELQNMTLY